MDRKELTNSVAQLHRRIYGSEPAAMAYAPGRVEILGNHTDYNEGTVLSAAIDMGICFAISPNEGAGLRFYAGNREEQASLGLSEVASNSEPDWGNYVRGVLYYINERGHAVENWDCTFYGDLLVGSGLSSSAALEVSAAYAAQAMLGIELEPLEVAKICLASEHNFVGIMSGLLDQFSSIFGEESHLIHSDFRSNEAFRIEIPRDIRFLLITPELRHKHIDSPYNERRRSCDQAAARLAALTGASDPKTFTLRDVDMPTFLRFESELPVEPAQRARHVVGEIDRVAGGLAALEQGDISTFGELMFQSHESSRIYFENSTPELDFLVSSAKARGALGARLSGGGWGGSLIAMLHEHNASSFEQDIGAVCRKEGIKVDCCLISPSGGAEPMVPPFSI